MNKKDDRKIKPHETPLKKYRVHTNSGIHDHVFECHHFTIDGNFIIGVVNIGPCESKRTFFLNLAPGEWLEPA